MLKMILNTLLKEGIKDYVMLLEKDETNTRLHERLESVEKTKWNALDKFDIPLSIHS